MLEKLSLFSSSSSLLFLHGLIPGSHKIFRRQAVPFPSTFRISYASSVFANTRDSAFPKNSLWTSGEPRRDESNPKWESWATISRVFVWVCMCLFSLPQITMGNLDSKILELWHLKVTLGSYNFKSQNKNCDQPKHWLKWHQANNQKKKNPTDLPCDFPLHWNGSW